MDYPCVVLRQFPKLHKRTNTQAPVCIRAGVMVVLACCAAVSKAAVD